MTEKSGKEDIRFNSNKSFGFLGSPRPASPSFFFFSPSVTSAARIETYRVSRKLQRGGNDDEEAAAGQQQAPLISPQQRRVLRPARICLVIMRNDAALNCPRAVPLLHAHYYGHMSHICLSL